MKRVFTDDEMAAHRQHESKLIRANDWNGLLLFWEQKKKLAADRVNLFDALQE